MAEGTCSIEGCERAAYCRGWCSRHYNRWWEHGDPLTVLQPQLHGLTPLERFRHYYEVDPGTGCWLWTGGIQKRNGYAKFQVAGRIVLAHRWIYEQMVGPIPAGQELDHVFENGCRYRHCVNYESHLEPVTHLENVRRGESAREGVRRPRRSLHS